jgi:hypothetical protein
VETPEEKELINTIIEKDIYRQWAKTLLFVNEFSFDTRTEKYTMIDAQREINLLGNIANRYICKRGEDQDKNDIRNLRKEQKDFQLLKSNKDLDFATIKTKAQHIIDEYYRLCLKTGIFG